MKKPEYSLKKEVSYRPSGPMSDEIIFPSGTLIFPFWGEHYVPEHIKERLRGTIWDKADDPAITCIIGTCWLLVLKSNIREER